MSLSDELFFQLIDGAGQARFFTAGRLVVDVIFLAGFVQKAFSQFKGDRGFFGSRGFAHLGNCATQAGHDGDISFAAALGAADVFDR